MTIYAAPVAAFQPDPPLKIFPDATFGIENQTKPAADTWNYRWTMKRFFLWFNAFRVLKYLNYAHDGWFEKKPVVIEAERLLRQLGHTVISQGEFGVLMEYRRMDRQGWSGLSTIQR